MFCEMKKVRQKVRQKPCFFFVRAMKHRFIACERNSVSRCFIGLVILPMIDTNSKTQHTFTTFDFEGEKGRAGMKSCDRKCIKNNHRIPKPKPTHHKRNNLHHPPRRSNTTFVWGSTAFFQVHRSAIMPIKFTKETSSRLFRYVKTVDIKFNREFPSISMCFLSFAVHWFISVFILGVVCWFSDFFPLLEINIAFFFSQQPLTTEPSQREKYGDRCKLPVITKQTLNFK